MIIDFHSHVLPGIDDGSDDVATSLAMLEASRAQGVDVVIATPHFYAEKEKMDSYLEKTILEGRPVFQVTIAG